MPEPPTWEISSSSSSISLSFFPSPSSWVGQDLHPGFVASGLLRTWCHARFSRLCWDSCLSVFFSRLLLISRLRSSLGTFPRWCTRTNLASRTRKTLRSSCSLALSTSCLGLSSTPDAHFDSEQRRTVSHCSCPRRRAELTWNRAVRYDCVYCAHHNRLHDYVACQMGCRSDAVDRNELGL